MTNHLFETRSVPFSGFDLAALNIQRGRDHGLKPYNEYRAACNLKRAATFEDLSREMTQPVIERLKQVYANVDDIDLWTGGLVETPLQGGLVGPTFACIIGNQFRSLRFDILDILIRLYPNSFSNLLGKQTMRSILVRERKPSWPFHRGPAGRNSEDCLCPSGVRKFRHDRRSDTICL